MTAQRKKTVCITTALVCVILVTLVWWLFFSAFSSKGEGTYVYIREGDSPATVYAKLEAAAAPRQMAGIKIAGALLNYGKHVRPGRYEAGGGVSSLRLLRNLRSGHQATVHLVVPVVHTLADLAGRLADQLGTDSATMARAFSDPQLLRSVGADTITAMTLFLPNTYDVYWDITPAKLLKRMARERDAFWTPARKEQARQQGLTPTEVYTLASIVEQESQNKEERPMIARMYLNRLREGMKLQADPTVKFALRDFSIRRIMHAHLTVDSPYNTYRYTGLPVGPICIPSINAIESVLMPASHDFLYMCAKEDFSGTHRFARSYEEHMANARRYAQALDQRGVK